MTTDEEQQDEHEIAVLTDDAEEAFSALKAKRAGGEPDWDMCEVRLMENPPRTVYRYCVVRKK